MEGPEDARQDCFEGDDDCGNEGLNCRSWDRTPGEQTNVIQDVAVSDGVLDVLCRVVTTEMFTDAMS